MARISAGVLLLFLLLLPPPAAAQAGPSSGTLVAAALETGGYVAQAQVLGNLLSMFERLGGLIYLCCILSAVLITALSGRYQAVLWLIVGPAIFFFLIRTERVGAGVDWQFGSFHDRYDLKRVLRGAKIDEADGQEVSAVFHHYNVLVSTTIQQLIRLFDLRAGPGGGRSTTWYKMMFMTRAKMIDDLFSVDFSTPGLWQLTRFTFLMCHDELAAARLVSHGQRDWRFRSTMQYQLAVEEYCAKYPVRNKTLPRGPAHDLVQRLYRNIRLEAWDSALETLSCEQLWQYMFLGAYDEMHRSTREALLRHLNLNFRDDMDEIEINQLREETLESIRTRLTQRQIDGEPSERRFECTKNSAGRMNIANASEMHGIPVIMATWLIRKGAGQPVSTGRQDLMVFPNSHIEPAAMGNSRQFSRNRAHSNGIVSRFKADQLAESLKYEVFTIAKMLPYLQGAGLYFLATVFPFFCLLVILPGQAGGFFVWMTFWAWFKLWDVGWALVSIADSMLWEMMPRRTYFRLSDKSIEIPVHPVTIFEAAFSGDDSYSLTTYWILVAAMLSAVPVLSAHAVLGTKKAVSGIFLEGVKSMGKIFSQSAADWLAMEQCEQIDHQHQTRLFNRVTGAVRQDFRTMNALANSYRGEALRTANTNIGSQLRTSAAQLTNVAIGVWNSAAPESMALSMVPMPAPLDGEGLSRDPNDIGNRVLAHFNRYRIIAGDDQNNENILQQISGDLDAFHMYLNKGGRDGTRDALFTRLFGADRQSWPKSVVEPIAGSGSPDETLALQSNEIMRQDALIAAAISRYTDHLSRQVAVGAISIGVAQKVFTTAARNRFFAGIGVALNNPGGDAARGSLSAFAAELQRFSTTTRVLSLEMERSANQHSAQYLTLRASQHYFEAVRSDEFAMFERLRAGVTGRAESWAIQEPVSQIYARLPTDLSMLNARLASVGAGWLGRLDANLLQGEFNVLNSAIAGYLQGQNRRIPPALPIR